MPRKRVRADASVLAVTAHPLEFLSPIVDEERHHGVILSGPYAGLRRCLAQVDLDQRGPSSR